MEFNLKTLRATGESLNQNDIADFEKELRKKIVQAEKEERKARKNNYIITIAAWYERKKAFQEILGEDKE